MLRGIQAHNSEFLTYLDRIEKKVSTDNKQISTGIRVTQASDDPAAISSILKYQSSIDLLNQTQTNLATAKEVASTADGALQSASSILDELTTIATQGVTGTTSSDTRTQLSVRVQQLLQQLVAVANTSVNGRYVFGGDNSSVPPYGFDWT